MTTLNELLEQKHVRSALVVDDAYDPLPKASDLSIDQEEWRNFFDDLRPEDEDVLRGFAPEYDQSDAADLPTSDTFVAAVWTNREQLRPELIGPVLARYQDDMAQDRAYLDQLTDALDGLGLLCQTAGRNFEAQAATADLIVIDLFLGSVQDAAAIGESKSKLKRVIEARRSSPPLVILMSRSGRLEEKRVEFRDDSGLLESGFRIVRKAELAGEMKLSRLLRTLASHKEDTVKLARFLDAWQSGVTQATQRAAKLLRTLDLSDYAQIEQLLLSEEGEPTGSYMVDIFDRVLQHEVERDAAIIDAASALNGITSSTYPPPYVAGSPDLQQLVYRSLFQHAERLKLTGSAIGVAFGDILRPAPRPGEPPPPNPILDVSQNHVLAILTPACDLQRGGAKRVLLLVGELRPLLAVDWIYKEDPARTPVIDLDGARYWIKWDMKHVDTIGQPALTAALAEGGGLKLVARLREAHALELQQKLLSGMGRVGLPALMPATFPIEVKIGFADSNRNLQLVNVPALDNDGVAFIGRPGASKMRLVLGEDAIDAIHAAVNEIDLATVHAQAVPAVQYLRENPEELIDALAKGLILPGPQSTAFLAIDSPSGVLQGQNIRSIAVIARNRPVDVALSNKVAAQAGVVFWTKDIKDGEEEAHFREAAPLEE
ncbi:hypothetical protein [Sinorhizobium medicae]|uniref:hypothetical protein n=1 Tax=Sinorhizobium medicae TaxID=110321 RepID=UPI001295F3D0|nr:hypothetical protein [Sinorhizobium medicae]MDX0967318.1 hypothetical protein [Sinorhizobium medicae]MQV46312.1 hypothetical protein [Sinorhizobium medicae]MQV54043.1 hypothetical protein [Sinorhizobium medicae]MQV71682.1 hypothetical protein [Sinorhizobium medicae]